MCLARCNNAANALTMMRANYCQIRKGNQIESEGALKMGEGCRGAERKEAEMCVKSQSSRTTTDNYSRSQSN